MSRFISLSMRASMLDGVETFMLVGGGTAVLRVLQFNTTLVDFSLQAAPFGSASADGIVIASAPISGTAAASGKATRAQLINQAGTVGFTFDLGTERDASLTVPSLVVTSGATQSLNALVLRMSVYGELTPEGSLTLQ